MKMILIAEDDADIGAVLTMVISEETAYHALLATDGFEALRAIGETMPDLFLLDYSMPGMSGLELFDRLHAIKRLEAIPCIMVSANLPTQELATRHIIGLSKPLELDELLDTINKVLALDGCLD
jgi:CheY-like chemotaxis protein